MAVLTSKLEIIPACSDLSNAPNTITSKIKNVYETSHYQQIVLALAKQVDNNRDGILVDIYNKKNTREFEVGQKVFVSFPEDAIHVFKE